MLEFLQVTSLGLVFFVFCVSVKVKLTVFVHILPVEVVPEMIYTVLGGTLNPTHTLSLHLCLSLVSGWFR